MPFRCRSIGRTPMTQPPGWLTTARPLRASSGPSTATEPRMRRTLSQPASSWRALGRAHARRRHRRAARPPSRARAGARASCRGRARAARSGTISGSSVRSEAASTGSTAFFDPATRTLPESLRPPSITSLSMDPLLARAPVFHKKTRACQSRRGILAAGRPERSARQHAPQARAADHVQVQRAATSWPPSSPVLAIRRQPRSSPASRATRTAAPRSLPARSSSSSSSSEATWARGTTSRCTGAWGWMSAKAITCSSSSTRREGSSPATILQKTQSMGMDSSSPPPRPRPGARRGPDPAPGTRAERRVGPRRASGAVDGRGAASLSSRAPSDPDERGDSGAAARKPTTAPSVHPARPPARRSR